ncbi:unnamed protein product [Meganyctiphanes norvegica]|uniref:Reverse transcriptase domain-containing protein n=1 Tax=Meganyctiphanes norvegica TaxID=48144 RepID=A0AAV2Q2F8_MEGNR
MLHQNQKKTKTDQEKTTVFTSTWKNVYKISEEENQQFDQENEEMVQQTLLRNSHKITSKLNINLQEIKDNNQQLPFNSINVALTIKELANKAPGPSKLRKPHFTNLPPNMIRNITHLFNCSYATGMYPTQFKTAEIILFPKETGEKSNPMNYRPISLLNFLGKVYAKLLNQKLVKHLEDNGIIKESQHGFRRKKRAPPL